MQERIAFLNGTFLPERELAVSVVDAGFVLGVTIAEQLRTFRGTIFRAEDHLSRLYHSLEIIGLDIGYTTEQLKSAAEYVVAANHKLMHPADDMGVSIFVTPGRYAAYSGPGPERSHRGHSHISTSLLSLGRQVHQRRVGGCGLCSAGACGVLAQAA